MVTQIITHTPIWVFGLFALLVSLGVAQSRPRTLSRARLALLPLAMVCLSFFGVRSSYGGDPLALSTWLVAVLALVAASLLLARPGGATYCAATKTFAVPGSWVPLAMMMGIFFTKYAVAVTRAVDPAMAESPAFTVAVCAVCGLFSGLFLARALRVLRKAWPQDAGGVGAT